MKQRTRGRLTDKATALPGQIVAPLRTPNHKTKISWILNHPVWIVLVVIILMVLLSWYKKPLPRDLPAELVGVWKTADPGYVDRFFEIDRVVVGFGTGGGAVSVGFVQEVNVSSEGGRMLYTISYLEDGARRVVSFYHDSAAANAIRFKNQDKILWTKVGTD